MATGRRPDLDGLNRSHHRSTRFKTAFDGARQSTAKGNKTPGTITPKELARLEASQRRRREEQPSPAAMRLIEDELGGH